jgi:high-affinity iron transporter
VLAALALPSATKAQEVAPDVVAAPARAATLADMVAGLKAALAEVAVTAEGGDPSASRSVAVRAYLDQMEPLEGYYGAGAPYGVAGLHEQVTALESEFHALLQDEDAAVIAARARRMSSALDGVLATARRAAVPLAPRVQVLSVDEAAAQGVARTQEIAAIVADIDEARAAYDAGESARALALVEHAYLEGFEVLEPLVAPSSVRRIESLVHLQLRPQLARGASVRDVEGSFNALRAELLTVDEALESGAPFMFTAVNSFAIIVREGLEAVLLIGAILAYLSAIGAEKKHQRRIYMGVGAGIGGSVLTWVVARTLLPVTGASRELLEGVTALVAVGVLLYVSHWLFQKAYLHDWKQYLRERVGQAASSGSVLAMAGLAFAAVYREGFETVLFYQAMLYDAPPMAVLTGFVPGMLLILVVGFGIIRLGVKLPLRKVFGFTNAILVYLAFVFLGKGLYNLQESGMFSPLPLSWIPDSAALQQIFGLYPVAQTVIAQLALATMLIATWVIYVLRTPPATTA